MFTKEEPDEKSKLGHFLYSGVSWNQKIFVKSSAWGINLLAKNKHQEALS